MGCTQSKIENEEAVNRCKERKQFVKEAVSARNAFAAAHSAYAVALKNTGAALSDYAHGEVQDPQYYPGQENPAASAHVPIENLPPPPPLPDFPASPLQRAATMPQIKIAKAESRPMGPTIVEEEENELENDESSNLRQRSRRGARDRRSGGSGSGGGGRSGSRKEAVAENDVPLPRAVSPPRAPPHEYYDFFFSPVENVSGPTFGDVAAEEVRADKKHVESEVFGDKPKRMKDDGEVTAPVVPEKAVETPTPPAVEAALAANSVKKGKGGMANISLAQIFLELDDQFLKASESAHEVSKMLEANRLHYHSNFADNRGHMNHSDRVMRVITWNRSFRGLPNADDVKDDFDSEEHETHATVLDKLLAWEKKLYDEVKAGELLKYAYQKKIAALNKQKDRGTHSESLEKTKAAVSHLHTRYIVDMQSMDSTVSEIKRLRDEQLYPKLVQLVDGMAKMWDAMRMYHESQFKIVKNLAYVEVDQATKETSEHHHERTVQLFKVVEDWHVQFVSLMENQKKYIKALKNWLKLNVIPIESSFREKVSSPPRNENPPIQKLVHAWDENLDKLPDELARSAIHNFRAVLEAIVHHQVDEMKLKEKCEETKRELNRKTRSLEEWRQKSMQHRTPPDEMDPDRALDDRHINVIAEKEVTVEVLKKRLEEEEDAYRRQCRQVREKTLVSFKNRLPELFGALSRFAVSSSGLYGHLRSLSQPQDVKSQ
ncbi:protein ALTERED PHOSPHATE STARVATION RESPONSE 1 [Rhodamnia argentea]|uniref:Protein ALTERED PHOSPHATE STARVATION RESPONSE 1 n=1 Tax=Rhodamnia argentea TaxID=178133 RepID=A0A8B8NWI0_9MYRT|nr:protein ALTERED PHOSPHATE STARVATION RESPONSE 1 [Rhodamnia argentea]